MPNRVIFHKFGHEVSVSFRELRISSREFPLVRRAAALAEDKKSKHDRKKELGAKTHALLL